jgi:hypothetical protein
MLTRHRTALAVLSLPIALALVSCGTGSGADEKTADSVAPAASGGRVGESSSADTSTGNDPLADRDAAAPKPAANTTIQRKVIATGALRLSTRHLADARQDAFNLVTGLGGHVADEQSQSDGQGRLDRVDLTLRVPSDSFGKALDGLSGLGTVRHREQSTKDVTTQVIDTDARVKAQRASVESIERLLARARTIGEIMSIERQLADRQAELDSLEQQQKYLADQTSLATIHVTLTRPAARGDDDQGGGFLSGLADGWHALGVTLVALGTAVGAVLPFAALLALVGLPVWLIWRRRTVATAAPPSPES